MVASTQRLFFGAVFCCTVLVATDWLQAQGQVYNTIQPVPEALKAAVYPFRGC
jgi:hypothetical protein